MCVRARHPNGGNTKPDWANGVPLRYRWPCDYEKLLCECKPPLVDELGGNLTTFRVVERAATVLELGQGHLDGQRWPVGPVTDHGLYDVGNSQDARPVRISPSRSPSG